MANDYGFGESGRTLVDSAARPGDVLLVLSCSGHSSNLISAAAAACRMDVTSVLFGSLLAPNDFPAGHRILVQSRSYSVIEVVHTAVSHVLVGLLRDRFGLEPPHGRRPVAANACSDRH
jgi:D-sedoheptulose 7-phosphate isomerase